VEDNGVSQAHNAEGENNHESGSTESQVEVGGGAKLTNPRHNSP